jgi:acyl-CoA synthetase (AMP-forming)/AMP-acid ligase II
VTYNLSALFERVADRVPDRTAIATPTRRLTYSELDERSTRLAHHLAGHGIGPGDAVGLQLRNGTEYLEATLAACKLRAIPVNVNYRYVERELQQLYADAGLRALLHDATFSDRVAVAAEGAPSITHRLEVGGATRTGSSYEDALSGASAERDFEGRGDDDLIITYTGGTTGLPKGVVWRHDDLFFAALGGGDPLLDKGPVTAPDELPERVPDNPLVQLCVPPLIHVSASWGAFNTLFGGGTVVLLAPGPLDADEVWSTVGREGVNSMTVVGDAMARPLLDALEPDPSRYPMDRLLVVASGGAILSPSTKSQRHRLLPQVILLDTFGSSETGVAGSRSAFAGSDTSGGSRFTVNDHVAVLDDDLRPVPPGSDRVGRLARRGHVPLRYHNDPEKSRATFVEAGGHRWVLPGDLARVEEDGTVVLLGRGSGCINTGGEKVFPEEVEATLKGHEAVEDVVVVGVPDDRWGEKVAAVVQPRPGCQVDLDGLRAFAREDLAGYKLPRHLVVVDVVERGVNGKPDYRWARRRATGAPA